MTATIEKYRLLVSKLYSNTMSENLKWKWDQSNYSLSVKVSHNTIELAKATNDNFEDLYVVKIISIGGYTVDDFNDEYINGAKPLVGGFDTYFSLMSALFEVAYRQATGADKALDSILSGLDHLEDDEDVPF